jgi:amidophosphoribosyltransferase
MPFQALDTNLTEKCAVFGIWGAPETQAARLTFYGLWALQHRGQESSGIVSSDGANLHRHAAEGLVATVYHEEDLKQLPGHIAIGHNRYSTSGGVNNRHNQPFADFELGFALAHNGNLPDCTKLIEFLDGRHVDSTKLSDSGMMSAAIGCYISDGLHLEDAIKKAFPLFTGVFSAVAMDHGKLVAFRDECGIRPLSLGQLKDGSYVIASETCAFDTVGAEFVRDVEPGELLTIDKDGLHSEQIVSARPKLDIFELVYFARPDSMLLGKRVNEFRKEFGRQLAREYPVEADVVVPVPDSAVPAAMGYAQQSGIPFDMGLNKNRYIHRTFIRPTAELRERDLKMKLNPVTESIKDKRVILVDDSIVRGTTMRQVVSMLFEVGAKEVHLMISSPPVRYPDFYGINTPHQADLMATRMSIEEMPEYLGATSVTFLSQEGMIKATELPADRFSTSCFDGVYPIPLGQRAETIRSLPATRTPSSLILSDPHTA